MELLDSTGDYIFAFCLYTLFNAWNIYLAIRWQGPTHRPSLFISIFGSVAILYLFFLAIRFAKKTTSRLEKWIGGFTVAICMIEAAKMLVRFAPQPSVGPIARCFAVSVFSIASLLAALRVLEVLRWGVRGSD